MSLRARIVGLNRTAAVLDGEAARCWHCYGDGVCWCAQCGRPAGPGNPGAQRWIAGDCVTCLGTGALVYGSTHVQVGTPRAAVVPAQKEETHDGAIRVPAADGSGKAVAADVRLQPAEPPQRDLFGAAAQPAA